MVEAGMKSAARNLELFKIRTTRQFGGSLLKGHAKVRRPLATKNAIHLVLKSQLACGARSLLNPRNAAAVERIVRKHAGQSGVRVYHYVNVGNHLHLVIRLGRQTSYRRFIRSITGLIARQVLRAERGRARGLKFWQARPFTRIVSWGRDYVRLRGYMEKNRTEALPAWGFTVTDPAKIAALDSG